MQASAVITVLDDEGSTVVLQRPAQRVVALAPHVTELVFAAGGGSRIVGAMQYSDFPEAARSIPRVGDYRQIDLERVLAARPDLLVIWLHGAAARQIDTLRKLGIPVYISEPHRIADIADSIERIGALLGTDAEAKKSAAAIRDKVASLSARYRDRAQMRVFYQAWDKPLYTLNGKHIINDAFRICGAKNIFAGLPVAAPNVTIEAVLKENPEVIISGTQPNQDVSGLEIWKRYPSLLATRRNNLITVESELLVRSGPRIVDGTVALCEKLEQARERRNTADAGSPSGQPGRRP